jgi:hypothetical protein
MGAPVSLGGCLEACDVPGSQLMGAGGFMLLGIRHDIHLLSGFYVLYGGFKYFDMIFIRILLNKIIKKST